MFNETTVPVLVPFIQQFPVMLMCMNGVVGLGTCWGVVEQRLSREIDYEEDYLCGSSPGNGIKLAGADLDFCWLTGWWQNEWLPAGFPINIFPLPALSKWRKLVIWKKCGVWCVNRIGNTFPIISHRTKIRCYIALFCFSSCCPIKLSSRFVFLSPRQRRSTLIANVMRRGERWIRFEE